MYYKELLKKLRVVEPKTESIISVRGGAEDSRTSEDILSLSRDWVNQIKSSARAASAAVSKETRNSFSDGFLQTFKQNSEKPVEPEVRKEAFVEKRSTTSPSTYANKRPSEYTSFKDAIDATEGGAAYDTLFSFSQREGKRFAGVDVSKMSLRELKQFANPSGEYGQWVKKTLAESGQKARVATPMGRYQFVGSTLFGLAKEMGLSDDTIFDAKTQDMVFDYYLKKTINSADTTEGKIAALRGAWEGFKSVPTATLASLLAKYEG